jgi:hypothetical protein
VGEINLKNIPCSSGGIYTYTLKEAQNEPLSDSAHEEKCAGKPLTGNAVSISPDIKYENIMGLENLRRHIHNAAQTIIYKKEALDTKEFYDRIFELVDDKDAAWGAFSRAVVDVCLGRMLEGNDEIVVRARVESRTRAVRAVGQ